MMRHCLVQFVVSQSLDTLVECQNDVAAVFRRPVVFGIDVFDNLAFVVPQNIALAVFAMQFFFTGQLQAFLPLAVDIGKTDDLREQAAHRIVPLRLFLESQPFNAHIGNLLGQFGLHLPF